jgi:predicted 3-demethylubiquinone-9 3-methyltransferase (glyoxalase superfamily)
MTSKPFTTCLWFDTQGEEAAQLYTSIFKDSAITGVMRYNEAGPGDAGKVMAVEFTINGQNYLALNGGPQTTFNDSVSLMVEAADQAELDYYWDRLLEGGGEPIACGWLKDRYGLRWQVVPAVFYTMIHDPDPAKVMRVNAAMLQMTKFDVSELERAYAGD